MVSNLVGEMIEKRSPDAETASVLKDALFPLNATENLEAAIDRQLLKINPAPEPEKEPKRALKSEKKESLKRTFNDLKDGLKALVAEAQFAEAKTEK